LHLGSWFKHAQGIGSHHVAGCGVRTRSRAAANRSKLAAPAFVEQRVGVTETEKHGVGSINLADIVNSNVASRLWQKAARTNIPDVIDENEPVAVVDAARCA